MGDILHKTVFSAAGGSAEISVPVPHGDAAPDGFALMQELLTSLPAAVAYLSGPDLIIDFANEACFRLTGDRDLLGRPLAEAFPELADRMDILHQIMKTGETVRGSEATVRFSRHGARQSSCSLTTCASRSVTPTGKSRGSCCTPPM